VFSANHYPVRARQSHGIKLTDREVTRLTLPDPTTIERKVPGDTKGKAHQQKDKQQEPMNSQQIPPTARGVGLLEAALQKHKK